MGNIKILGVRFQREAAGAWNNFVKLVGSFPNNMNPAQGDVTRITVGPHEGPVWEDMGWRKQGNVYSGRYVTGHGSWNGWIIDRGGFFEIFILNPPMQRLKHSEHGRCFIRAGYGAGAEHQIHITEMPKDVGSAILHIQELLEKALAQY